jgi:hypothetical protein
MMTNPADRIANPAVMIMIVMSDMGTPPVLNPQDILIGVALNGG